MNIQTTKKPKVRESDVQRSILDYLKAKHIFHYRNNSGAMAGEHKGKRWFMRFGAVGSPDVVAVIDGQYVGIECKATGGKQSPGQKEFQQDLEDAGGRYIMADSLESLIEQGI